MQINEWITIIGSYVKDLWIVNISAPSDYCAVVESISKHTKGWRKDLRKIGEFSYLVDCRKFSI